MLIFIWTHVFDLLLFHHFEFHRLFLVLSCVTKTIGDDKINEPLEENTDISLEQLEKELERSLEQIAGETGNDKRHLESKPKGYLIHLLAADIALWNIEKNVMINILKHKDPNYVGGKSGDDRKGMRVNKRYLDTIASWLVKK